MRQTVLQLHHSLEYLSSRVPSVGDDELLPPKLRELLDSAFRNTDEILVELRRKCLKVDLGGSSELRSRLKFAWKGHDRLKLLLVRLHEAESGLLLATELLNMHVSLSIFSNISEIQANMRKISHSGSQVATTGSSLALYRPPRSHGVTLATPPEVYAIDPWLRWLGFYGVFSWFTDRQRHRYLQMFIGYKLPVFGKCLSLYTQLSWSTSHVSIQPCHIRLQNRIPIDSPFLTACRKGDARMIKQLVDADGWLVNTRSSCKGVTPLLLAIDSQDLDAIRVLLNAGADANIGDDERTLPIFKATGYKDKRLEKNSNRRYVQLPPPTTKWLDILDLLIQNHASVHEVVGEKTMTTMKIVGANYQPETTIRFFRMLAEEKYTDFDLLDHSGLSAVVTALSSRDLSIRAIDMLVAKGINIKRIYEDGRTALHYAAMNSSNVDVLKHLHEIHGLTEIDRQDHYGWTPLHYAIGSPYYMDRNYQCGLVVYLLKMGADPYIKGQGVLPRMHPQFRPPSLDDHISPFEWAAESGCHVALQFRRDMIDAGLDPPHDEDLEDVFHDAVETVVAST
ncbi:unnamed protein product [Periconia digitata]|uniref:Ankyrin n=1 Tax=Periconia digitata TaxID=1303443 RepID=A0A9W4U3L3_9PLEO|nr:unnamed protein product [Periconia digitata]